LLHLPSREKNFVSKEVQAIEKLCGPGTHTNIVEVLNHGLLSNFPYYFIDMELCDLNLHDYIHRETPTNPSESVPYFIRGVGSATILQIWTVMSQIASGVEYVHRQGHIHRDIKPGNGNSLSYINDRFSFVLLPKLGVETGRFWAVH
jgi:serine/threonine protein kinase